jgi:hypothetical protein
MSEEKQIKAVKFIGGRHFLPKYGTNDLSVDEWNKLSKKEQRHLTRVLKLYEVIYD